MAPLTMSQTISLKCAISHNNIIVAIYPLCQCVNSVISCMYVQKVNKKHTCLTQVLPKLALPTSTNTLGISLSANKKMHFAVHDS